MYAHLEGLGLSPVKSHGLRVGEVVVHQIKTKMWFVTGRMAEAKTTVSW